jgi:hypothetical protein
MKKWFAANWLNLLAILALIGAFQPMIFLPYAYFQLMNWIVVGSGVIAAYRAYLHRNTVFVWLFISLAVIFNPLAPLYFSSDIWKLMDIIAIALIVLSFFINKVKK